MSEYVAIFRTDEKALPVKIEETTTVKQMYDWAERNISGDYSLSLALLVTAQDLLEGKHLT